MVDSTPKKFKSKVLTFPQAIREKINKMICEDVSYSNIQAFLKNEYGQKYTTDISALKRYGEWLKNENQLKQPQTIQSQMEETKLPSDLKTLSQPTITLNQFLNKKQLLENLVQVAQQRLNILTQYQNKLFDDKTESIMLGYIDGIRKLLESLAKISGEISDDETKQIDIIVQSYLSLFFGVMYDTIKEIIPNKLEEFQEKFKKNYENKKQDLKKFIK